MQLLEGVHRSKVAYVVASDNGWEVATADTHGVVVLWDLQSERWQKRQRRGRRGSGSGGAKEDGENGARDAKQEALGRVRGAFHPAVDLPTSKSSGSQQQEYRFVP